jgi:hypothetical protein
MTDSPRIPGVISAFEAYTLDELKSRLGIENKAWWRLRDAGCRSIVSGKRRIVLGSEVLRVLGELQASESNRPAP